MGTNGANGHDPSIKPKHWGDVNIGGSESKPEKKSWLSCGLLVLYIPAAAALAVAGAVADTLGWLA